MALDPGTKATPAFVAAGATTAGGAAAWSLADTAAVFGIVASVIGIVCTVTMTAVFIRSQRRRLEEQEEHHRKQRDIERGADPGESDDAGLGPD